MAESTMILSGPDLEAIQSGAKHQHRSIIEGVPMFTAAYDREWRPHAIPPGGAIPDRWSWWEGPPHGPSLYHTAVMPVAQGDLVQVMTEDGSEALTIRITGAKIQRLLDITDDDAIAEGVLVKRVDGEHAVTPRERFFALWARQHGAERVQSNPWVFVVRFETRDIKAKETV